MKRAAPSLLVRNLEPEVVAALRKRAAQNGRSMEAEHRDILRSALARRTGQTSLKHDLLRMPLAGEDADFARPRQLARRVKL